MRSVGLIVAIGTILLVPADSGRAQQDDLRGWVLFAPNIARKVDVTRNGALVASLQVPAGTFLVASYDEKQRTSFANGRWEFQGEFRLYAQPAKESSPSLVPGGRVDQIRAQAPLVLSCAACDVLMENIEP